MKKLTAGIFFLCIAAVPAFAQRYTSEIRTSQNPVFAEWEAKPILHPTPPQYANESALFILNSIDKEYKYEGRYVSEYYTLHRIIKVLDERGIESFNKIAIPVYHNSKIESIKARTILPNGKVFNVSDDMIKVTRNESGAYEVDIALEGVEKNAEIELLLKEIKQASYFGSEQFQFPIPVLNTCFEMKCPKEMHFEEKGYNGFPTVKDTIMKGSSRRQITVYVGDIPALEKEPFSFYDLYCMRAEYRLNYFYDEGDEKTKLYTWDDYAKNIHTDMYKLTKKERAAADRYISTLGVTNTGNDLDNIKKIETGIKNGIVLNDDLYGKNVDDLDTIITKKEATESGYVKLFAACFTAAGVSHELGMTSDKYEHAFDTKFENWGTLNDYVFYFPSLKKFLAPASIYYRYPVVPDYMVGNKGIFCLIPADGHITGAMSEIRTITPLPASESMYSIKADVSFDKEMDPEVNVTYSYSGYTAAGLRTAVMTKSNEQKNELIKKSIGLAERPDNIVKYAVANEGFDNYYSNIPLEISATVKAPQLIEKADKRYLFRLGDIIGNQTELYKKTDRKLPVDLNHPFTLSRTITVNIPKGYKILNAQTMRKQADYVDGSGKPVLSFASDYKIEKDKLIVTVNELYARTHYKTSEYARYRDVMNTSADFDKVTLVLAKK